MGIEKDIKSKTLLCVCIANFSNFRPNVCVCTLSASVFFSFCDYFIKHNFFKIKKGTK